MKAVDARGGLSMEFQRALTDLVDSVAGTGGTIEIVKTTISAVRASYPAPVVQTISASYGEATDAPRLASYPAQPSPIIASY